MTQVPVNAVANLSNLKLNEAELKDIQKQLDDTVSYIKNLNELDTKDALATSSPTGTKNVYFVDGMKNVRKLKAGVYKVDRIIE